MRVPTLLLFAVLVSAAAVADAGDPADAKPRANESRADKTLEAAGEEPTGGSIRERTARIDARLAAGDFATAHRLIGPVVADPAFAAESEAFRISALSIAGQLALMHGEPAAAYDHAWAATRLASAPLQTWQLLAQAALNLQRADEAALAYGDIARRFPDQLAEIDQDLLAVALRDSTPAGAARRTMLDALAAAEYAPPGLGDASHLWYELALLQLAAGDIEAATATAARVQHPAMVLKMRVDRRFDALAGAADTDFAALAGEWENRLRTRALLEPDLLELQTELASAMLMQGGAEAVLALTDDIAAGGPYRDADRWLIWMYNSRAEALVRLQRGGEAPDVLSAAAALPEMGGENVSLILNLGVMQVRLNRPTEALAAVAGVGRMSGFGRMVLVSVQHSAAWQQQDAAAAEAALAYLAEHRADSPEIHLNALLEEGRIDEAAAALIAGLDDASERGDLLVALQRYRKSPALPGDVAMIDGWAQLRERSDVLAAVARHGRILDVPLYRP